MTDKANRFTRADIDTWRKEKEKLETEMLKLKSVQQIINEESAVYSQKQRHERDLANLKEDYKDVEAKLKRFQDEMTSINDALKPIIPEREATEKSIKEFEAKIVELDAKIGGEEFRPHGGLLLSRDWRKSMPNSPFLPGVKIDHALG